jgi:hypothetical protein
MIGMWCAEGVSSQTCIGADVRYRSCTAVTKGSQGASMGSFLQCKEKLRRQRWHYGAVDTEERGVALRTEKYSDGAEVAPAAPADRHNLPR